MKASIISPSILNCDLWNIGNQIKQVTNAPWLHIDVMDGHFVPNLSFGLSIVDAVKKNTKHKLDAHLMIENPEIWAPKYAEAGCYSVTFHLEAANKVEQICKDIHRLGSKASIAVKPDTPAEEVIPYLKFVDMILVMTVEPGFGGQKFMEHMMPKVSTLRKYANRDNLEILIEVDGGISKDTIEMAAAAGADVFVAGSAVFCAQNAYEYVDDLAKLANQHHWKHKGLSC